MTDKAFIQKLKTILDEEVNRLGVGELQETDLTVLRVMNEYNLTKHQARHVLDNLSKRRLVEKIKVRNPSGGGALMAYRPIEKK